MIAARLVKRWWGATPEHDVDDERYVLQGHVGRVTKPIRADKLLSLVAQHVSGGRTPIG